MKNSKKIPAKLFVNNRNRLYNNCGKNAIYIFLSAPQTIRNGDQYFPYRQNSDLFYFSGINQEQTTLIFCPEHPKPEMREIAFIIKPSEKTKIWHGHKLTIKEAKNISGIKTIFHNDEFNDVINLLTEHTSKIYMPFAFNQRAETFSLNPSQRLQKDLKSKYPKIIFQDISKNIALLRSIKSKEEQELMQEACNITSLAFNKVLKNIKPGMSEYEIEAILTHEFISNGATGHAYSPIVASGKNACVLHYITNSDVCKNGDLILMDFGAEYKNYAADCSRTIPVNKQYTKRQREVYIAVLSVFKQVKKQYTPGNTINGINNTANKLIEEQLLKLGLISSKEIKNQNPEFPVFKKYFPHGTTHFLGLDVHDVGSKDTPFETGMVLTCEPGIYIPEENIGIRIENDIIVAEKPIDLTEHIPVEPDEIEKLMLNRS